MENKTQHRQKTQHIYGTAKAKVTTIHTLKERKKQQLNNHNNGEDILNNFLKIKIKKHKTKCMNAIERLTRIKNFFFFIWFVIWWNVR